MKPAESKNRTDPPPRLSWLAWLKWVATEDHCEWANRYVYWLKSPLGILLLCGVFALLCGVFVAPQVLLLLAVVAAVVLVGAAWPSVAVRGLRCQLIYAAPRGREGKPTQARLVVTNRWPWPVWGLAIDDPAFAHAVGQTPDAPAAAEPTANGPTASGPTATQVALARIDGWSRSSYNWSFVPPRRGVYPSREVRIVTGFPFGLRRAARPVEVRRSLTVWPETFWLPPLEDQQTRRDWGGELSETAVGMDGTRLGARDFRPGDSLRDVHWAKSARHERLIVSEREASVVADCTVVVDVDPAHHAGVGGQSTLEWSLKIAASICESAASGRGRVNLWLGGVRHTSGAGGAKLAKLLDGIARFGAATQAGTAEGGGAASAGPAPAAQHARPGESVISIGTDASGHLAGRAIVLSRRAFDSRAPSTQAPHGWIQIEAAADVPGQVLRGWRGVKRGLRHDH
ncbi:MAG: DUF58 domain-containing protein [Planctomycetota bacterium]